MKVDVEFVRDLSGHKDGVYTLAHAGEESSFFSGAGDGMVVRWELQKKGDGEAVASLGSSVYSLCHFPETNQLVAGSRGGGLFRFDLDEKKQSGFIQLNGDIFSLQPLNGSAIAATGGGYIYRLDAELKISESIHPTEKSARAVILSLDSRALTSGWSDGKIRMLDTNSLKEQAAFTANEPSVFSLLQINGKLISGGRDAQLKIWDTNDYSLIKTIPAHWFTVNHLVLSPDKKLFASASRDKSIKIWDASTFELLKVIDLRHYPAHTHSVNRLLWTPFENLLISAGDDRKIKVWKVKY